MLECTHRSKLAESPLNHSGMGGIEPGSKIGTEPPAPANAKNIGSNKLFGVLKVAVYSGIRMYSDISFLQGKYI